MGFRHVPNSHHMSTSQQVQRTKALDPTFIASSKEKLKKKKKNYQRGCRGDVFNFLRLLLKFS